MNHYMFHAPGMSFAVDLYGDKLKDVKESARDLLGVKRLPPNCGFWRV